MAENQIATIVNAGTLIFSALSSIPYGSWTHVLVTINSTSYVTHYINGVQSGTAGITGNLSNITTATSTCIGNTAGITGCNQDRTFNGSIDEVIILNRVLNGSEILTLYDAEANKYQNNFTNLENRQFNFTSYAVDSLGNKNQTSERLVRIINTPSAKKFIITNNSGSNVASIDDNGNMYITGNKFESQSSLSAPANAFVLQNSSGTTIGYINNGNLNLTGTISTYSDLSGLTSSNLEIRNSTNGLVAFFDNQGNLKLRGGLIDGYTTP